MKTYLHFLLICCAVTALSLVACKPGGGSPEVENEEVKTNIEETTEIVKELPDTFNIEGENYEISTEGLRVRLVVCDCEITAVGNNCEDHNYSVGDTITQPCYAERSCPCNGRRWLVFNDGCRIKAKNIKDCYSRWFD